MDLAAFEGDRKAYDAVERCLERISEGAAKLGDYAAELTPDQPSLAEACEEALRRLREGRG